MNSNSSSMLPHGHGNRQRSVSSLGSGLPHWVHNQGAEFNELRTAYHEHQELASRNQALSDTCAEWARTIQDMLSNIREVTADRNMLVRRISTLANGDRALLQWMMTSEEVFATPQSTFPPTPPVPELGEVPTTHLAARSDSRHVVPNPSYRALPQQTPPMRRLNPSPITRQVSEIPQAEQADHSLPREPNGDRQEERRHERQQRQRQRIQVFNGQRQLPFHFLTQINEAQMLAQHVIMNTQHQLPAQVSSPSNIHRLGQTWHEHSLQFGLINPVGPSLSHVSSRLAADKLPTAAAAA